MPPSDLDRAAAELGVFEQELRQHLPVEPPPPPKLYIGRWQRILENAEAEDVC